MCPQNCRDGATFLYTGGSQTFAPLGLKVDYSERPSPSLPSRHYSQREIIASGGSLGEISIADNPSADGSRPSYELPGFQAVTKHERFIVASAKRYKVDPDLIRAIMWVETTHGYYDAPARPFDADNSIFPMNINTTYWGERWGSRDALRNPANNINAGAQMLHAISTAMPNASIAAQATIYNDVNATRISDYGMRVQTVYHEKPWLSWDKEPNTPWYIPPRP